MKKIKAIIILTLLLLAPVIHGFAEVKSHAFRDLYWGESLQEIQANRKTEFSEHSPYDNSTSYAVYFNNDESLMDGGNPVASFFGAGLWNNQLYVITLYFPSGSQARTDYLLKSLNQSLQIRYGKPVSQGNQWATYETDQIQANIGPFDHNRFVTINILDKRLNSQVAAEAVEIEMKAREAKANQGW